MLRQVPLGLALVDQPLVEQPLDCAAPCPHITKPLIDRHQIRILLEQLIPEPAERTPPTNRPL